MDVVGLDLSLTATGIATPNRVTTLSWRKHKGMQRLAAAEEDILGTISDLIDPYVFVEGYSYSSRNSHAHALGELGGIIRLGLYKDGVPYLDVPPTSLKKFATGKGNAPKEHVLVAAVKRLNYDGHDDNEADALWLQNLGYVLLEDSRAVEVPKTHMKALEKLDWEEEDE